MKKEALIFTRYEAPFGSLVVLGTAEKICFAGFSEAGHDAAMSLLRKEFPEALISQGEAKWHEKVQTFLSENRILPRVLFRFSGTLFQCAVWKALLDIPRGKTATYAEVARRIGHPRAVRAVGTAIGANPISLFIPCHRVIRSDATIGGYRWGTRRKKAILAWESLNP